jgi:hypothetical protein
MKTGTNHGFWVKTYESWDKFIILLIPNAYFAPKIEELKQDIETFAKEILGAKIAILTEIAPVKEEKPSPAARSKKKKTYQEQRREITTFDKTPNFRSQKELDLYLEASEQNKSNKNLSVSKLVSI